MKNQIKKLSKKIKGATAIEYGLMAALIAVVIIPAVAAVGHSLSTTFAQIASIV